MTFTFLAHAKINWALNITGRRPDGYHLLDMLMHYLRHQEDVVTRRTRYDLNKAEERDHILQGLLIALDNIDEIGRAHV